MMMRGNSKIIVILDIKQLAVFALMGYSRWVLPTISSWTNSHISL